MQVIKQTLDSIASDNSLVDSDLVVFSVKLPEGEKIQDQKNLFDTNGMRVRAVKNIRSAIVTATYSQFQALRRRVDNYAQKGDGKSYFDYIDDFRSYIGSEKNSTELQKTLNAEKPPATVDVQLMLIPNLEKDVYDTALTKLVEKVQKTNGVIQGSPYYLSDGTPVVRAIIPASTLTHYENDLAIYRIEETDFFNVDATQDTIIDLETLTLNPELNLETLPIVVVLDSGVIFPTALSSLRA